MKKIICTLFLLLLVNSVSFAKETPINVIYIHGANQVAFGGEEGFKEWTNNLQKSLKANFEKSELVRQNILKDAYIKDTPDMLYWAHRLDRDKEVVDSSLEKSSKYSLAIPQFARTMIAQVVHDAVWLQKKRNMYPILNELNDKVRKNYKNGEKTILVGYSAGTFITFQYMLQKFQIIDYADFLSVYKGKYDISEAEIKAAKEYMPGTTCGAAINDTGLIEVNKEGYWVINRDKKIRQEAVKKLKEQTEISCIPQDAVIGVLNFGSPISVFYSDLVKGGDSVILYFEKEVIKNIVATNKFYLTPNYSKDPIAMSNPDITFESLQRTIGKDNVTNGNGFIYDTIVKGGKNIAVAHCEYWAKSNKYGKLITKAYEQGYKEFYSPLK